MALQDRIAERCEITRVDGGIAAETATGLFDFSGALIGNTVPIAFAVLIGATAVVSFRTRVFSRWLSWTSAIIAVGLLTPVNYIVIGFAWLWVLVASMLLYTAGRTSSPTGQSA